MAAYSVDVRPRARRSLRQLDPSVRKAIVKVIDGLAVDPRPAGAAALTGHRPYLRVRSGDYRVIFSVDDPARVVTVAAVGHRREIYRSFRPVARSSGYACGRDHRSTMASMTSRRSKHVWAELACSPIPGPACREPVS